MKKLAYTIAVFISVSAMLLQIVWPAAAHAAVEPVPLPPVLITEVQAGGSASASEEFIELFNTTAQVIDLSAHTWQLQIASSSATNWDSPQRTVPLSGLLEPGGSYVVASQYTSSGATVRYLPEDAQTWFSAGIAATAGHVRLVYETYQLQTDASCVLSQTIVDQVEWSPPKDGVAATPSIDGRTVFVTAKTSGLAGGTSLQRERAADSQLYLDSGSDATDFAVAGTPSPGSVNALPVTAAQRADNSGDEPVLLPEDACDPNPPQTDPGTATGDDGSDETSQDDTGSESDTTEEPANDAPVIPEADQGLLPPRITELLPNPGSPQTDAADEFIELYNPNSTPFDLSGFILEVGITTKHQYVFSEGASIAPTTYAAFYSAVTGLGMSNSGGQAQLLDPLGGVLSATDPYPAAKDNQAWAFTQNKWQWTLSPTPNAANALLLPQAKAVKAAKTTAKKTTVKKAATTKAKTKKTTAQPVAGTTLAAEQATSRSPLHPGVLAVIGVFAVLYGAYEYRQDMANYIRRFRDYRANRRANRQKSAGWGGD